MKLVGFPALFDAGMPLGGLRALVVGKIRPIPGILHTQGAAAPLRTRSLREMVVRSLGICG
jgi:hypothetical protein